MSYSASDTTKKITKVQELTQVYRPFWQPLFDNSAITNPAFTAKLCYYGKEFTPRVDGVRFFPSELNNKDGVYLEFYDWDFNNYEKLVKSESKMTTSELLEKQKRELEEMERQAKLNELARKEKEEKKKQNRERKNEIKINKFNSSKPYPNFPIA